MKFFIVVPTFNAAADLDRCLSSIILTQPGKFDLHVHIQDGGSTDDTVGIGERWAEKGVTLNSEPDGGLYDAINKAASAHMRDADVMTWLGSDDFLIPGALATAASIFAQIDIVSWLTGTHSIGNERGELYTSEDPFIVNHRDVAEGLHDGRSKEFIMQEGTFWRTALWNQVGGLDTKMRYAADWDLWCRFAALTPLYVVQLPLGRFTRRPGQVSGDLTSYYAEVDAKTPITSSVPSLSYELKRWPGEDRWMIFNAVDRRSHRSAKSLLPRVSSWLRR